MLHHHFPLSETLCREIEKAGTLRNCAKGEILYHQGDRLDSVFFLLSGLLSLWVSTPDDEQLLVSVTGPGTIMGEILLLDKGQRPHTGIAIESCRLYRIPNDFMRKLATTDLEFSCFLNQSLTSKLRTVLHAVYRRQFSSVTQRLADILYELSSVSKSDRLSITQDHLCQMAGCSRPKMISILKQLEQQNIIQRLYGQIRICSKEALINLANPSQLS